MKGRVLVIEDDQDIALSIGTVLRRNGLEVDSSADGKQGLRAFHLARPEPFDLVVLDIGLPSLDGWAVLERIRDLSDVPVLILTAHGHEREKVRGLHGGADDYLTKPFGNGELAARVEALLRRPRAQQPPAEVYDDGRLLVKLAAREVSVGGAPVPLTPTEFRLLAALIRNPGQTLSPEQLLRLAWNDPLGVGPDRVKFGVMRLRRKLGQGAGEPGAAIVAVRGFGYRYMPPGLGPQLSCTRTATWAGRRLGQIVRMSMSKADGTRGRILVVEDDPEAALFAVYVLVNRGGFEVTHTADPAVALRLAAAEHWDLLLTDQDLPGMTGLELLGALRTVAPGLPVALMSAHAAATTDALIGQACEYLEKPLRVDQLIAMATTLISRGRRPLGTA